MNDPLRDNRIFPEEMHQKPPAEHQQPNLSWVWFVIGALLLVLLAWYIYTMYKAGPASDDPSIEEQQAAFEAVKNASPPVTEEERDAQVELILSGKSINR